MSNIDPHVALEIEKARSAMRQYAEQRSGAAQRNAIAVLSFVALALGLGAAFGIDHLVASRLTTEVEDRVSHVIDEELPRVAEGAIRPAVEGYLSGQNFADLVEGSLDSAVREAVPESVISFIEEQQADLERLEQTRRELEALGAESESSFDQAQFNSMAESAIVASWSPASLLAQIHAQATCVALGETDRWITAVPRSCEGSATTCDQICSDLGRRTDDQQIRSATIRTCEAAIHIYPNFPSAGAERVGLKTYLYPA